jgi:hypothetical protein
MASRTELRPIVYRIASRVIGAITGVLVVELVDRGLDSIGLSEEKSRMGHAVVKGVASAVTGVLVDSILSSSPDGAEHESARTGIETDL